MLGILVEKEGEVIFKSGGSDERWMIGNSKEILRSG